MVIRRNCTPHNSKTVVIISRQARHSPATILCSMQRQYAYRNYLQTICNTAFLNQHKKHRHADSKVATPHTFVALWGPGSANACGGGGSRGRPGTGRPTST